MGIRLTNSSLVLVLDGDDKLEAKYIESVSQLLNEDPTMVIASSWLKNFWSIRSNGLFKWRKYCYVFIS